MTGKRILDGMREARAIAEGAIPAPRIHHNGHVYVAEEVAQQRERAARKAALEEAAGIAETCEWWTDTSGTMDERIPIAAAIRARAEKERP